MNENINYIERKITYYRKEYEKAVSEGNDKRKRECGKELANYREMMTKELKDAG
jgi:hypothetical protein